MTVLSDPAPTVGGVLTDDDRQLLDFEQQWWHNAGAKQVAIRAAFDCTPTRYYQRLLALTDRPEALTAAPMLVHRLQRRQQQAARQRRTAP